MLFTPTPLAGAYLIEPERRADDRGFFVRTFCENEFAEHDLETRFVQVNAARNTQRGIVRGLHRQLAPHEEVKVVRCVQGSVFDVIVDCREGSPTRYRWFGATLSAANGTQLYVPKGFAHGYQVLEDESELNYLVSAHYAPGSEAGLRWNDPVLGIEWPVTADVDLSEKDAAWDLLKNR